MKELQLLIERDTFRIVLRSEAGKNPNIIPSRFVLHIKHTKTSKKSTKLVLLLVATIIVMVDI